MIDGDMASVKYTSGSHNLDFQSSNLFNGYVCSVFSGNVRDRNFIMKRTDRVKEKLESEREKLATSGCAELGYFCRNFFDSHSDTC